MQRVELFAGGLANSLHFYTSEGDASLTLADHGGSDMISVRDERGYIAVLGTAELETQSTEVEHKTSAALLVMFGKDGRIISRAP